MIKEYIDYLKDNPKGYWFKAKLFGWGWTPATWQGWFVTFGFIVVIILNTLRFELNYPEGDNSTLFVVQTIAIVFVLLLICYKTGEKPRWQWGIPKKNKDKTNLK